MSILLLRLIPFLLFLPLLAESGSQTLSDDILGLIVFKADLQDPESKLASWNEDDNNPCKWVGIKCDPKTNRVAELSLDGFSLSGKIGRGLLQLQSLRSLSLSNNNFSGTLSPDLIRLESLQTMDLSENNLSGSIPDEFFTQCRSLRSISLANNAFSGMIPPSVGSCSTLADCGSPVTCNSPASLERGSGEGGRASPSNDEGEGKMEIIEGREVGSSE